MRFGRVEYVGFGCVFGLSLRYFRFRGWRIVVVIFGWFFFCYS